MCLICVSHMKVFEVNRGLSTLSYGLLSVLVIQMDYTQTNSDLLHA